VATSSSAHIAPVRRLVRRPVEGQDQSGAQPYDFRRPTKLSRDHVRALQMCYETYARRVTTLLTSGLRQLCQVNLVAIEHQSYEEYMFEFSVPTALACVDYLLGGPGGDQPTRQLTDLESGLLRNLIDQMLSVLRYAVEPTIGLDPKLRAIEFNPQFVQAAGASDGVIVGSFQMRVGNQVCVSTLCVPFASLLPRLQVGKEGRAQTAAEQQSQRQAAQQVRAALGNVPVEVALSFQPVQLTPNQIVRLEPGDVINLRHRVTTPLTVQSGGITFAHALAGRQGSRLAGLVVSNDRRNQ